MNRGLFNRAKVFILTLTLFVIAASLLFGNESMRSEDVGDLDLISRKEEKCQTSTPDSVVLEVVHILQNDTKSCATTSIAMVISQYENLEKPLDKETVWNISGASFHDIKTTGNDMESLQRIADHYGYKSEFIEDMEIADVERLLQAGIPVMLNIQVNESGNTHALLAIGYDRPKKRLYINDPSAEGTTILGYDDLEARWLAGLTAPPGVSYRSGFVVYPNDVGGERRCCPVIAVSSLPGKESVRSEDLGDLGFALRKEARSQTSTPDRVKLDVVYIPQNDDKSGATTSIAMVISHYKNLDNPLDKDRVWEISGTDVEKVYTTGNDMKGLKRIADYYGYRCEFIEGLEIADLEHLLAEGVPVILNLKRKKTAPQTEVILVTGYDKNEKIIYINHSGSKEKKALEYADLEARWAAHLSAPYGMSYHSGFIVYPKEDEKV